MRRKFKKKKPHTIQQNNASSRNLYQAYNKIKNVHKKDIR